MFADAEFGGVQLFIQVGVHLPVGGFQTLQFFFFVFGKNFADSLTAAVNNRLSQPIAFAQTDSLDAFPCGQSAFFNQRFFIIGNLFGRENLRQNHGNGFQNFDFSLRIFVNLFFLHDQNADSPVPANQRNAEKGMISIFPEFGFVGKFRMFGSIGR